jgi:mannose/fructose/N-acetylgalactosamine-specific phosphotransferase system component IIB
VNILHIRIDDRLIHGQVLVGWGTKYLYEAYVICDGELAVSDWEKEIYLAAVPTEAKGMIITPEEFPGFLKENSFDRLMVLFRSPAELRKSIAAGYVPEEVIVGGMHDKTGRKRIYDYLYLSDEDIRIFREMMSLGVHFICRDLPDHPSHELSSVL